MSMESHSLYICLQKGTNANGRAQKRVNPDLLTEQSSEVLIPHLDVLCWHFPWTFTLSYLARGEGWYLYCLQHIRFYSVHPPGDWLFWRGKMWPLSLNFNVCETPLQFLVKLDHKLNLSPDFCHRICQKLKWLIVCLNFYGSMILIQKVCWGVTLVWWPDCLQ